MNCFQAYRQLYSLLSNLLHKKRRQYRDVGGNTDIGGTEEGLDMQNTKSKIVLVQFLVLFEVKFSKLLRGNYSLFEAP